MFATTLAIQGGRMGIHMHAPLTPADRETLVRRVLVLMGRALPGRRRGGLAGPLVASASVTPADIRPHCRAGCGAASPAPDRRGDRHRSGAVAGDGAPHPGTDMLLH